MMEYVDDIKVLPLKVVNGDPRYMNEEQTVVFVHNEIARRGLKFRSLITSVLRENRRYPHLMRIIVNPETGKETAIYRGNRQYYGKLNFFYAGQKNKVFYLKSDVLEWLESYIIPKCRTKVKEIA